MKSLKRTLCLVLAMVMVLGFFGIASAESFKDDDTIQYKEAVGVMTGIGSINGMGDNTFAPTGKVTRAQAAKMVAYAVLGADVAKTLPASTSRFKDVDSNFAWAIPSIEYLANAGVINGRGNGTFDPNGEVTGYEIAKMLLCAAGYGKNGEFTGDSWALNVAIAEKNHVFTGTKAADRNAAATREECALYCYNGIMSIEVVKYSKDTGTYSAVAADKTIATNTYGMNVATGIVTGNATTGVVGTSVSAATLTSGKISALADPTTYKYATDLATIGQVVNVYYKDASTVYAMQVVSNTVNVASAITNDTTAFKAAFGTVTNDAPAVYNFTANYAAANKEAAITGFTTLTTAAAGTYAIFGGEIVSYIAPSATTIKAVTAIGTTAGAETITLTGTAALANNATSDVVNAYDGIKVGDLVACTIAGSIYNLAKTTTVSGKISEIGTSNSFIVLDGTKYAKSTATDETTIGFTTPASAADYANNTYTLYLDASGKVFGSKLNDANTASNVVYAVGTEYEATGDYGATLYKVQCVDSTGAEVIYTSSSTQAGVVTAAGFYKVTVAANGMATFEAYTAVTDLVVPSTNMTVAKTDIRNGDNYYYASDVQFLFVTGSGSTLKVTKVTGVSAAAGNVLTTANALLYINKTTSANKTISTVVVAGAYAPAATGTGIVYVPTGTTYSSVNAAGYVYSVFVDGVKTSITSVDDDLTDVDGSAADVTGKFASYTVNSTTGAYDFTAVNATGTHADTAVATNGVYGNYINGIDASSAVVVDVRSAATIAADAVGTFTSVSSMAAVNATKTFTISYTVNSLGAITCVYVTAVA